MVNSSSTKISSVTRSLLYQNSKNNLTSPLSNLSKKPFHAIISDFLDDKFAVLIDDENNKFILDKLINNFIGEELEVEINPDMKTAKVHGKNNTSNTVRILPFNDTSIGSQKVPKDQVKLSNTGTSVIRGIITHLNNESPQSKLFHSKQQLDFKISIVDTDIKQEDNKGIFDYNIKSQVNDIHKTSDRNTQESKYLLNRELDYSTEKTKSTTNYPFSTKTVTNVYSKSNNTIKEGGKKNIASNTSSTSTSSTTKNTGISSLFSQLMEKLPKFNTTKDSNITNQTTNQKFKATVLQAKNNVTVIKTEFGFIQVDQKLALPKDIIINIQQSVPISDFEKKLLQLINNLNNNWLVLQNLTTLLANSNYKAFIKLMVHYDPAKLNKVLKKTNSLNPEEVSEWIENLESSSLDTTVKNTLCEISNQYSPSKTLFSDENQIIKLPLMLSNELQEIDTKISYNTEQKSLNFTMECDLSDKFTINGTVYFKDQSQNYAEYIILKIFSEKKIEAGLRKEINNIFHEYIRIIKIKGSINYINEVE